MTIKMKWLILLSLFLVTVGLKAEPKRMLLLCDPVQQAIVQEAVKELKADVQVTVPKNLRAYNSTVVLEDLDKALGDQPWDIIYFNFGIADLVHRDPNTRDVRLMNKDAGGQPTSLDLYEKNVDQIVQKLKLTKAKLLWGSTTPMVTVHFFASFQGGLFNANSELEYNQKAEALMKRHQVEIIDLHAHVMGNFQKEDKHPPYIAYGKAMKDKGKPFSELFKDKL